MEPELEALRERLKSKMELNGIRIRASYAGGIKEEPLRVPVITVGLGGVRLLPVFLEEGAPEKMEATVRFLLYSPLRTGSGEQCHAMMKALLKALYKGEGPAFTAFTCGTVTVDRNAGAYTLEVLGTYRGYAERGEKQ